MSSEFPAVAAHLVRAPLPEALSVGPVPTELQERGGAKAFFSGECDARGSTVDFPECQDELCNLNKLINVGETNVTQKNAI